MTLIYTCGVYQKITVIYSNILLKRAFLIDFELFFKDEWGPIHMVLKGHRSIVNQVRYNKNNNLIASSGVEKMVKVKKIVQFFFSFRRLNSNNLRLCLL